MCPGSREHVVETAVRSDAGLALEHQDSEDIPVCFQQHSNRLGMHFSTECSDHAFLRLRAYFDLMPLLMLSHRHSFHNGGGIEVKTPIQAF